MMTIPTQDIQRLKNIITGIDDGAREDLKYLYDNYGINLFVDAPTKDIHKILWKWVHSSIMADPRKAMKLQRYYDHDKDKKNHLPAIALYNDEIRKVIDDERMTEHYKAYNIINTLHPIIFNLIREYKNIKYDVFQGIPMEFKSLGELYSLYNTDPKDLDDYLQQYEWNSKQKNYKEVRELRKAFEKIGETMEKYNIRPHFAVHMMEMDELRINNILENAKQ